jgi:hypothetical protein
LSATVDDGSGAAARWLGGVFKSVDWLLPAYLTMGFINRLAEAIHQAKPDDRLDIFREAISIIYGPQYLATFFLERYSKIIHVRDFSRQIDESFRAYFSGYRLVAITAMIPVLEGIIRKIASASSRDVGSGTQGLLREFEAIVEDEENSSHRYEERLVMLELLRDFIRDRFLKNTNRYDGLNQFNRHGILHGVFEDYGEELNFMRVITILDLLCFIITLRGAHVSMFAPAETDDSRKLASEYIALQEKSKFFPAEIPARVLALFTY